MYKVLIKKQLYEIFRQYFYDAKKNKERSLIMKIFLFGMFILLMVGILGGMFAYMALSLCKIFVSYHVEWFYFLIMAMIGLAIGIFGSVFNTYSSLYLSKDNDLLLSLPIEIKDILISRLMTVYLIGLMYSSCVMIPTIIVYFICTSVTPLKVIGCIVFMMIISMMIFILSCILGYGVAKISQKLKNKSYVTVIASIAFIGLYYFIYFKAQTVINQLLKNVMIYGKMIQQKASLICLFGKIGEGNVGGMILYSMLSVIAIYVIYLVLSRSFINIVTSQQDIFVPTKNKKLKAKTPFYSLLDKEFKKITTSAHYMLNCGFGTLGLVLFAFIILIKGSMIQTLIGEVFPYRFAMVLVLITGLCLMISMNDFVVPSISLEGKNMWIIQSLPVDCWLVIQAKIIVQLLLTGIPLILCDLCILITFKLSMIEMMMLILIPLLYSLSLTLLGMVIGLKNANLSWTNEITVIKQSMSVFVILLIGWMSASAIGLIYIAISTKINIISYCFIIVVILAFISGLLYRWLKIEGKNIIMTLK